MKEFLPRAGHQWNNPAIVRSPNVRKFIDDRVLGDTIDNRGIDIRNSGFSIDHHKRRKKFEIVCEWCGERKRTADRKTRWCGDRCRVYGYREKVRNRAGMRKM